MLLFCISCQLLNRDDASTMTLFTKQICQKHVVVHNHLIRHTKTNTLRQIGQLTPTLPIKQPSCFHT